MSKKRIAILLHGGIGTGAFGQGIPILHRIAQKLSQIYVVEIYSHATPQVSIPSLNVYFPDPKIHGNNFRWWKLTKMLKSQHSVAPYEAILCFWGYPAGVIGTALAKYLRIPSIVYLLGGDSVGIKRPDYGVMHHPIKRFVAKWAYASASSVCVLSRFQQEQLANVGVNRSLMIIPWGIELDVYAYRERFPRGASIRFINVAHLTPVKDQHTLLKTFAIINQRIESTLSIVGFDAGMKRALLDQCARLNIDDKVSFQDMVPYAEMRKHYESADVMLHTSLSEAQGLVINEAAACGLLIGGTKVGLIHDLSDNECVRVEIGQFTELADEICRVLNDQEVWRSKIRAARKWCEDHDINWTVSEIAREIEYVTEN